MRLYNDMYQSMARFYKHQSNEGKLCQTNAQFLKCSLLFTIKITFQRHLNVLDIYIYIYI